MRLVVVALVVLAGCGSSAKPSTGLTEQQKKEFLVYEAKCKASGGHVSAEPVKVPGGTYIDIKCLHP